MALKKRFAQKAMACKHVWSRKQKASLRISFPEQAALLFQAVELTELENAKPAQTWEHAGTIPFGNVAGSPAFLQVFKETNPVASCGSDYQAVALLEHKGETFGYRECFSASLIEDAIQKKKASVVLLEKNHAAAGSNYVLQGAARH
ncbi:hypothetical protein P4V33_22750 [Brevibacillus borstelensis]|uniref:hypothetical protein n=1 Tax=Brevibacillus borstelensis TaxID=45462 RepID=UPI002E1CA8BE|nr:hypothetical protein [Brevibacillus borstelensis]